MELKHATDIEMQKHIASHKPLPSQRQRDTGRIQALIAKRNQVMKRAHVDPEKGGLMYGHQKEDDESKEQEILDRRARSPGAKNRAKLRLQATLHRQKMLREGKRMKSFSQLKEAAAPASPALVTAMNSLLADTFAFYLKAHNYHWNIEGADFAQYHDFLGKLYEDAHGAVDDIAERIRTLNAFAKGTMENFLNEASITEDGTVPGAMQMLQNITADNDTLIGTLTSAFKAAEADGKVGLANFIQDRIDIHEKHGWMLRSLVKGNLSEETIMKKPVNEVLKPSMGASEYIRHFVHSENPKFAGKSKAQRTKMALGAYYGDKKGK